MKSLARSWTVYRFSSKGHKESNTGTALFSENMAFGSSQTDLVTIVFILTEVIDVNSLFGVITYKRIAENKHICY